MTYTGRFALTTTTYIRPNNAIVKVLPVSVFGREGAPEGCRPTGSGGRLEQAHIWARFTGGGERHGQSRAVSQARFRSQAGAARGARRGARGRLLLVRRGGLPPARRRERRRERLRWRRGEHGRLPHGVHRQKRSRRGSPGSL